MNEIKRQAWVARDKSGQVWIYIDEKPSKNVVCWHGDGRCLLLDRNHFPSIKWEDEEPTEVEITISRKEARNGNP